MLEGLGRISEEPTWVVPAHQDQAIDIFSAETGNTLAWILHLFRDASAFAGSPLASHLEDQVRERITD